MNEIKELLLPDNILSIKEIKEGYEERKKYIVETRNEKFFIKVLPNKESIDEIEKRKWIYKIYEEKNIPVIPIINILVRDNKTILIYKYYEYKNLKDSSLTLEQYEDYGKKVAIEVKKMNEIKNYPDSFKTFDLKSHCDKYIERLKKFYLNPKNKMNNLFSDNDINNLILRFKNLCSDIKNDAVTLNHNDFKIAYIMIDENNNFCLVDIDPIGLTYRGYNIIYSIYTFLYNNSLKENEKAFLKGFIKKYDPSKSLMKEWEYFIISDFINELERLFNLYYKYLENNISFVKEALFNKNNILVNILYDE